MNRLKPIAPPRASRLRPGQWPPFFRSLKPVAPPTPPDPEAPEQTEDDTPSD